MQEYLLKLTVTYGLTKQKELYIQNIYTCNIQKGTSTLSLPTCSLFILFRKLSTGDREKKYLDMLFTIISQKDTKPEVYQLILLIK